MRLFKRKKKLRIQICVNNLDQFYDDDDLDALDDLIETHNINVREMDCLSYCDECVESPYCLINNTYTPANSPENLLLKIKEHVDQQ